MMQDDLSGFLTFEKIAMGTAQREGQTGYVCQIKSLLNGNEVEITARLELPQSERTLRQIEHEIALAIHQATNPARLRQ